MIRHLREARARAKAQGWGPVLILIGQALRNRIANPWHVIYWMPTTEVSPPPLPPNGSFMVITDPARELNPARHKALMEALGADSSKQAEQRLASGARLHVLFVDDRVAGYFFSVSGAVRRFQHVVLTDVDSVGIDGRVQPEFRGQGLFPILMAHGIHALRGSGQERFYADALETNTASRRTLEKIGCRSLTRYRMSWRRHYRYSDAPL